MKKKVFFISLLFLFVLIGTKTIFSCELIESKITNQNCCSKKSNFKTSEGLYHLDKNNPLSRTTKCCESNNQVPKPKNIITEKTQIDFVLIGFESSFDRLYNDFNSLNIICSTLRGFYIEILSLRYQHYLFWLCQLKL